MLDPLEVRIVLDACREQDPATRGELLSIAADHIEDKLEPDPLLPLLRREAALRAHAAGDLSPEWVRLQCARPSSFDGVAAEALAAVGIPEIDPCGVSVTDGLVEGVRRSSTARELLDAGYPIALVREISVRNIVEDASRPDEQNVEELDPIVDAPSMADFVEHHAAELHIDTFSASLSEDGIDIREELGRILRSPACASLHRFVWESEPYLMPFDALDDGPSIYVDPVAALAAAGIGRDLRSVAISEYPQLGERFAELLTATKNPGLVHVRLHSAVPDHGLAELLQHEAMQTVRTLACGLCIERSRGARGGVPREDFSGLAHLRSLAVYGPEGFYPGEYARVLDCRALTERVPTTLRDLALGSFDHLRSASSLFLDPALASLQCLSIGEPLFSVGYSEYLPPGSGADGEDRRGHGIFADLLHRLSRETDAAAAQCSNLRVLSCPVENHRNLESFKALARLGYFTNLLALELNDFRNELDGYDSIVDAVREVRSYLPNLAVLRVYDYADEPGCRTVGPLAAEDPCLVQSMSYGRPVDSIFRPLDEDLRFEGH